MRGARALFGHVLRLIERGGVSRNTECVWLRYGRKSIARFFLTEN